MKKIWMILICFISFAVWFATGSSNLEAMRLTTPAGKAESLARLAIEAKEKELAIENVKKQESLEVEKVQNALNDKITSSKKFIASFPLMVGQFEVYMSREKNKKNYHISVEPYYVPKGSIEGEGLFAHVIVNSVENGKKTSYFISTIDLVNDKKINMKLDERSTEKYFEADSEIGKVEDNPLEITAELQSDNVWKLKPIESYQGENKMQGSIKNINNEIQKKFTGTWISVVNSKEKVTIQISAKEKFLDASIVRKSERTGTCKFIKKYGYLLSENTVNFLGGKSDPEYSSSVCYNEVFKVEIIGDNKLKAYIYYDSEPALIELQKK